MSSCDCYAWFGSSTICFQRSRLFELCSGGFVYLIQAHASLLDKNKNFTFFNKARQSITLLINVFSYTVLLVVYPVTDAERCMSRNITDWTGTFKSPSYPLNYAPNMDCFWLLRVSEGNQIEINFQDFAVGINNII